MEKTMPEPEFDDIVTQFMHLYNLPFLSKQREVDLENLCRQSGWDEGIISRAKNQAVSKSNWGKNSFVRSQLRSDKLKEDAMASFFN